MRWKEEVLMYVKSARTVDWDALNACARAHEKVGRLTTVSFQKCTRKDDSGELNKTGITSAGTRRHYGVKLTIERNNR